MSEHDQRDDYDDEPWKRTKDVEAMVRWPASILSAFGLIQLAFSILSFVSMSVLLVWSWFDPQFAEREDVVWYEVLIAIAAVALCVFVNVAIVISARRLRNFKSYGFVQFGIALFFFSLPFYYCCFVTAPVAIWALVVVLNPDVRARFKAVARGKKISPSPGPSDARRTDDAA